MENYYETSLLANSTMIYYHLKVIYLLLYIKKTFNFVIHLVKFDV